MKQKNLYNVTVVGSFTKDILVWAEDEDAALDFAQSICDNTDLIRFEGDEPLDVTAEDVEEIDPIGMGEPTEECCENCRGGRACCAGCGGFSCGRIVGSADGKIAANGEETASQRKVTEGCKCSGDACANCGKCDKRGALTLSSPSAGKEAEALRKLTEVLGGPFVGILID